MNKDKIYEIINSDKKSEKDLINIIDLLYEDIETSKPQKVIGFDTTIYIIYKGGNEVIGYKNTIDEALNYISKKTKDLTQNSRSYNFIKNGFSYAEINLLKD